MVVQQKFFSIQYVLFMTLNIVIYLFQVFLDTRWDGSNLSRKEIEKCGEYRYIYIKK